MKTMLKNASSRNIAGFLFVLAVLAGMPARSQSCSVNAGISQSICGTTATLSGSLNGTTSGSSTWSFVSGPATPTIADPGNTTTVVNGMTVPGVYTFRLSQACQTGGTASQTVTITANPEPAGFAITNPDITECNDYAAINNLSATPLPPGWTGVWTAHDRIFGNDLSGHFIFSAPASPSTTVQLVPAQQTCGSRGYRFRWTITSPNGQCSFSRSVNAFYYPDINQVNYNTSPVSICGPGSASFAATNCGFWSNYLPVNLTVTPLTVPGGFAGTLTATLGNPSLIVNGFTVPGTYTFNVTMGFATCGTSRVYGPFTANVGSGSPNGNITSGPANFCLNAAPPSITFNFTVGNATDISFLENTVTGYTHVINGAGTTSRSITFTPAGSWIPGEFRFALRFRSATDPTGICETRDVGFVYIYDNNAPSGPAIANSSACIPFGASVASGTITLPNLNMQYMGNNFAFASFWTFQKLSGPSAGFISNAGINSATASFSGLTAGIYTFQANLNPTAAEEFNCSGSFTPPVFTITIYNQQGSNAGPNRTVPCIQDIALNANPVIAPSMGTWTQVSGPSAVSFAPNANDPNAVAKVAGLGLTGTYVFRWTISDPSGNCPAVSSDVTITQLGTCSPPFPVSLISFTAKKKGNEVLVEWTTVTEQNSKDFTVEWSKDGINWQPAGVVPAAGNSNSRIDYSFIHQSPVKGVNYYRLRQSDLDGTTKYFSVVMVRFDDGTQVTVLPNPVKDNLYLTKVKPGSAIRLNSVDGKTLYSTTAGSENITINMKGYPAALYLLTVTDQTNQSGKVFRVVKN